MSSDEKNSASRKKYTQHYRKKWENIPQLRGWLSTFPSKDPENVKAFCKYCQRKLVPHVTGLLKHSACRAHIKHARNYMDRIKAGIRKAEEKAKLKPENKDDGLKTKLVSDRKDIDCGPTVAVEIREGESPKYTILVNDPEDMMSSDLQRTAGDEDAEVFSDDEPSSVNLLPDHTSSSQVKIRVVMDNALLSTHVLEVSKGTPVVGLGISLYRLQEGRWTMLSDSVTDAEGRCGDLLKDNTISMQAGRYKMHYDVNQYYAIRNQECFFPFVEVVFDISNPMEKYHVPLLLSPFSYTTYRGC